MMLQMKVLIFLLAINIISGILISATTSDGSNLIPGAEYMQPLEQNATLLDAEQQWNTTEATDAWTGIYIPIASDLGYIVSVVGSFVNKFRFLIDGFATTLESFKSFIPSGGGILAVDVFINIFRWLGPIMFVTLVFELITGRRLLP